MSEDIRRNVEAMYVAMVAAGLVSEDRVADEVIRAAGYPVLPPIIERLEAVERDLRACEGRLQVVEASLSRRATLVDRVFAWLKRPRIASPSRRAELSRVRAAQGKVE